MLVGISTGDDAGVFRLSDDLAIVNTVDFFTPIVDDPFTYGQISAANALSDVYAMGGVPRTALNIVCWPQTGLPTEMLADILRGAADTAKDRLIEHLATHPEITAATFRDLLGASRKFAIALLDHFDHTGVTTRVGDTRRLRSLS